jgi:hypothetical protein
MTTFNVNPFSRYDYVQAGNPATDTDPIIPYPCWLNVTTGEEFVCIDSTINDNAWRGSLGTIIGQAGLLFREELSHVVTVADTAVNSFTTNFSVECTFSAHSAVDFGGLVSKWNTANTIGWHMAFYDDQTITFGFRKDASNYWSAKSAALALDTIYKVRFFYKGDGSTPILYIDDEALRHG